MKQQFKKKMKEIFSPQRDDLHGDEDDDFQPKPTPTKRSSQDPNITFVNDPPIETTINSFPFGPNNLEISNQNNYSANLVNNGQAEQEEEEIELQYDNSENVIKQTCHTLSEAINSDLNTSIVTQ